jgi:hypothetical protein
VNKFIKSTPFIYFFITFIVFVLLLAFLLRSSPSLNSSGSGTVLNVSNEPYSVISVFFATDRNKISENGNMAIFGKSRSSLNYGYCQVSIPKDHRIGFVEIFIQI